jgi:pimeloyl-ACP methyl ester carboxylesterase
MLKTPILWKDQIVEVEYQWLNEEQSNLPILVFLHEGLGSISLWRDFPMKLCKELGVRALIYSRPAYGWSTPRGIDENWQNDFMHQQAIDVLPKVLESLQVQEPVWIFGHSDGGSIALLAAANNPQLVKGIILMAPHIFVENLTISSIKVAKEQYLHGDLKGKLTKYHQDVDSAFWGWNDIWLNPNFKQWNIVQEISSIQCPLLALQGFDDPYGTMAQIDGIKEVVPHANLVKIVNCGHSPHREQPIIVLQAIKDFLVLHHALT